MRARFSVQWLAIEPWTRKRVTGCPSLLLPDNLRQIGQYARSAPLAASGDSPATDLAPSQAQTRTEDTFKPINASIAVDLHPRMLVAPKGIPNTISTNL